MNEIILRLTVQEVDYIGAVLSERPYREVKPLIEKLVVQANDKEMQSMAVPPVVSEGGTPD